MAYRPSAVPSITRVQPNKFTINQYLGCDHRGGTFLSDIRRSPDAVNMVWGDNPYLPETRAGYKSILNNPIVIGGLAQTIWGIHTFKDDLVAQILIHAGTRLYLIDENGDAELVYSNLTQSYSQSLTFQDKLYIVGCGKYLQWDGLECVPVEDVAYIPTTVTGAFPSRLWTDTYLGDGVRLEFPLNKSSGRNGDYIKVYLDSIETDVTVIDGKAVFVTPPESGVEVRVNYLLNEPTGTAYEAVNLLQSKRKNSFVGDGITTKYYLDSQNISGVYSVTVNGVETPYTVNNTDGIVTFTTAPADGDGIDNVIITFWKPSKADVINNCSIFSIYGGENDMRVFLSGNPNYRNRDWVSGLFDPTYFPDNVYQDIGSDNTAIMLYVKQFDTQMPIKSGNTQGDTAWLRQYTIDSNGRAKFPIEQGSVGIGAVSTRSLGYLQGEPLFLSSQGVVAVVGTEVDNHRLIQDRSELVNPRLTKEQLETAFALVYENRYHLFVGGHVYVCDARMRYTDALGQNQYEWNYWTNINATAGAVFEGYMYFGYDGQIYRFKKDEIQLYTDNGAGIPSKWTTPVLYFGDISVRKTIEYIYVLMSDISENDIKVSCILNGNIEVDLVSIRGQRIFTLSGLALSTFSIAGSVYRYADKTRANLKKIDNAQFIFSNTGEAQSAIGLTMFQTDFLMLTR
jgi:hypothetical protein